MSESTTGQKVTVARDVTSGAVVSDPPRWTTNQRPEIQPKAVLKLSTPNAHAPTTNTHTEVDKTDMPVQLVSVNDCVIAPTQKGQWHLKVKDVPDTGSIATTDQSNDATNISSKKNDRSKGVQ
eukprot:Platyproteum_vivax@DN2062_c0_g1_i2.p1